MQNLIKSCMKMQGAQLRKPLFANIQGPSMLLSSEWGTMIMHASNRPLARNTNSWASESKFTQLIDNGEIRCLFVIHCSKVPSCHSLGGFHNRSSASQAFGERCSSRMKSRVSTFGTPNCCEAPPRPLPNWSLSVSPVRCEHNPLSTHEVVEYQGSDSKDDCCNTPH